VPIGELVTLVCEVVGYDGGLRFDTSRPDGTPRKLVDITFATSLGWQARTPLKRGLEETYRWFVDNVGAEQRRAVA
jgi:GDP-L-fucose synthase